MKTSIKGAVIASAVASMFAAGTALAADKPAKAASKSVKCNGGNACSGKSACATDKNACAGMNSCKGKGWTMEQSEKACTDAGGKPMKEEKSDKK